MTRSLIAVLGILVLGGIAQASVFDLQTSSFTATADSFKVITTSPSVLYSVCITSSSTAGSAFTLWNATSTAGVIQTTVTIIDTSRSQTGCYSYNTYLSSGIVYSNTGTTPAKLNINYNTWSH